MKRDEVERAFEGQTVLQSLLAASGSVADVEDVVAAFGQATAEGVPASVVISALWDDEPRFESPDAAARLFGNLLGLYDLIASGTKVDVSQPAPARKREKAPRPEKTTTLDEATLEAVAAYFEDFPKEREKLEHAFENRQDALVSWLDASGLSDDGFMAARWLVSEVFATLELTGQAVPSIHEEALNGEALPAPWKAWLEEHLTEMASDDEQPMPQAEVEKVRALVSRAVAAMHRHV